MSFSEVLLVGFGPLLLLLFVLVPRNWANRNGTKMKSGASGVTILVLVLSVVCALRIAFGARIEYSMSQFSIGIYFDRLSAIMFLLVSFLGAVVTRYALNYLDGDGAQGHFLKWLYVTIGAVLTLIIAGNLALFTFAWVATSLSLNKLLTFYGDRPAALIAARKKFVISRLGDACLIVALLLVARVFGSWQFSDLFAQAQLLRDNGAPISPQITAICLLLVGSAMLKSAQFPFHSWLPDTMETPTPVSALMHAGIINAGGFLVVRLSPILSLSPIALNALAIVGTFTAVFASLVMMTQASVKRMLAFSTIAQMGFMMLQCGLGAFSIAVLHIVAHSLYKAHAFLSSGNVVSIAKSAWVPAAKTNAHPLVLLASFVVAILATIATATIFRISLFADAGALVLSAVFVMALTHLLWSLWGQSLSPRLIATGFFLASALSVAYFALHLAFENALHSALPHAASPPMNEAAIGALVALFGAVFLLQAQLPLWSSRAWCRTLYVHARNGFYFNTLANRAIQKLWPAR